MNSKNLKAKKLYLNINLKKNSTLHGFIFEGYFYKNSYWQNQSRWGYIFMVQIFSHQFHHTHSSFRERHKIQFLVCRTLCPTDLFLKIICWIRIYNLFQLCKSRSNENYLKIKFWKGPTAVNIMWDKLKNNIENEKMAQLNSFFITIRHRTV